MSETMGPTISPVPSRVRLPPWTLDRLCIKSYFDACIAPKLTPCLNTILIPSTYNVLLKSNDHHSSDTQQQILDAEREISHLENNCIEKLELGLLEVSIYINDYEITDGLLRTYIFDNFDSNLFKCAFDLKCDKIIMRLIREGQDINCVLYKHGDFVITPLFRACWLNDYEMVELLLRHGACLVPEGKYKVIEAATQSSDARILRLLLSHLTDTERTVALRPVLMDTGLCLPFTSAILSSNWENLNVLIKSLPDSWWNENPLNLIEHQLSVIEHRPRVIKNHLSEIELMLGFMEDESSVIEHQPNVIENHSTVIGHQLSLIEQHQSSVFDLLALSIITKTIKPHEQTEWLNQMGDYTNWNFEMLPSKIYMRRYGKDSLLLKAIQHNNDPVVECIVRNHLHRFDTLSLQTALHAAVKSRCQADVINNILECLPESDRSDVRTIKHLYRTTRALQHKRGFTALHVAADLGITTHFRALLHRSRAQALFEDNCGMFISPLSLAAKHPCLWPVFTKTSMSREIDRRRFNLTELAHRYDMFPSTDLLCIPSIDFSESQQTWVNIEQAQAHVTHNFSQLLKMYQITPVWDSKSGESSQITTVVMKHLSQVSSLMKEKFPFLAFDVILSGSSEENTKAIAPDELDFILPLTFLSHHISLQNTSTTEPYISVKPDTILEDELKKHEHILHELFSLFVTEFRKCISMLKPPRGISIDNNALSRKLVYGSYSPFELKLQWSGGIYKNINIKVDIVPAVVMTDINKLSIPTHVQNKIEKVNLPKSNVYAVFKSNTLYPNQLRLSFSEHEAALIKQASEDARKGYTLAKCLRDSIICPKVQLPYSSEYMEAEQSISTYVLKTCFISLLKERHQSVAKVKSTVKDTKQSKNIISTKSIKWAKMIYAKLEENLTRHDKVPHIFYEDWDVYLGKKHTMRSECASRDQMLTDRKISVTLQHCEIITKMLNTLHKDLKFNYLKDSKIIRLLFIVKQIMWDFRQLLPQLLDVWIILPVVYCLLFCIGSYYTNFNPGKSAKLYYNIVNSN